MKMKAIRFAIISVGLIALVSGCEKTNSETHILHTEDFAGGSLVTDAKQRIVWTRKTSTGQTILCAEPSPDVAQAFSEAMKLAATLSASNKTPEGSEQKVDASGEFGRSYAGAVAELGQRLAVIQLLRDEMYRACEAYANGALTKVSYTLKLARLDKKMATLLTSEIAAGALNRPSAAIDSSSTVEGVDQASLKKAKEDLIAKIDDMKNTGGGTEPAEARKTALDAQRKAVGEDVDKLVNLSPASLSSGATVHKASVGATLQMPQTLVDIHQNFLDDTGLEPLMDACVTAMSGTKIDAARLVEAAKADLGNIDAEMAVFREWLDEDVAENDKKLLKQYVPSADFDGNRLDQNTRREVENLLAEKEKEKTNVLGAISEGGVFVLQCMRTFMGQKLDDDGYIARVIEAKKNLRIDAHRIRAEFELLNLQTCRDAANLLDDKAKKQEALAACVVKNE